MKIIETTIPDVVIIEPTVFQDDRGFFLESYHEKRFQGMMGISPHFVQDNHSRSSYNVLRGLHYQIIQPQAKLVRVVVGEIFDVAVDLRRSSVTFGQWVGVTLSGENKRQLWIPRGFAHGFVVRSTLAEVLYKADDYYAPQFDRCLRWNDVQIGIQWNLTDHPIISMKDQNGKGLQEAELFP